MGKPCPKYTAEFKRRAVRLYNERGTTYAEVAAPMALPALATIWCIALPQRGTTQLLAARGAWHRLTASTTVETPVMVAGALVAGYYALFALRGEPVPRSE